MDYYIIAFTNCITQWNIFRKTMCEMFPKQKHYGLEYRDNFYVFHPSLYTFNLLSVSTRMTCFPSYFSISNVWNGPKYTFDTPSMKLTLTRWGGLSNQEVFAPVHQQAELVGTMQLRPIRTNRSTSC